MSKRSLKDMVLELGDLDITEEDMKQAVEIKKVIDDAMLKKDLELGFEHVVLWWLGSEPADA
jgi:hypothetical protein